jgi:AraC-like DNA-binding protein
MLPELTPVVVRYYNESRQNHRMYGHKHDENEIMYVKDGKCRVICMDPYTSEKKEFVLGEGDYIYLRGGTPHSLEIESRTPCRILNVEFNCQAGVSPIHLGLLSDCREVVEFWKKSPPYAVVRGDDTVFMALLALQELLFTSSENKKVVPPVTAEASLAALLLFHRVAVKVITSAVEEEPYELYIQQVKRYIEENFDDPEKMNVPTLAREVNISPSYLQRLFKLETGMTLISYINQQRLKKAQHLLRTTDLSTIDIAVSVGVNSRQRLTQLFTEYESVSPGEYRRQCRNHRAGGADEWPAKESPEKF